VKPRRVAVDALERGLGLVPRREQRCPCSVQGRDRPARLRPRRSTRTLGGKVRMGFGSSVAEPMPESEASGARERTPTELSYRGGDQAVGGRARGSSWLQKSTSGAWSRPKGHGSSPLARRSRGELSGRKRAGSRVAAAKAACTRAATPVAGSS